MMYLIVIGDFFRISKFNLLILHNLKLFMLSVVGILVVFVMVFGGYALAGGKFAIILHAVPHELMMIDGASLGSFLLGNKGNIVKGALKDFTKCFKGPKWNKKDYKDLLCLMFLIIKLIKTKGLLAVEEHIENPANSSIFNQFPKIISDHFAIDFICDTFRMVTMSLDDPYQVEDLMQRQLDKHHHEALAPSGALQGMADGLPAIGIVAAVLGIIKTMGSIDQPPAILGKMIGGALVGTFLGVFLSYCLIGPMSSKIKASYEQDGHFYMIIRHIMVAYLKGNAAQVAVEVGRGNVPSLYQPSFFELEESLNNSKG